MYYILLGRAYKHGEISVVYPVARGSNFCVDILCDNYCSGGVGLTSIVAYVFLKEDISAPVGWLGIWSIVLGVLLMGLASKLDFKRWWNYFRTYKNRTQEPIELVGLTKRQEEEEEGRRSEEEEREGREDEEGGREEEAERGEEASGTNGDLSDLNEVKEEQKTSAGTAMKTIALSLLVGFSIMIYSVTDKLGVGKVDPVTYMFVMFAEMGKCYVL